MWYSPIAVSTVIIVGLLVSYLTQHRLQRENELTVMKPFLPQN